MTGDVVIRAEGLGKKYVIGHEAQREPYVALRDVLARGVGDTWRKTADMFCGRTIVSGDTTEEFWALKDVSFEVERGEVLGIIGHNGAGKSTLLKILSRITEPSEGRVTIEGRVASLLEVGTGFHPELTGRENIYLNGAILGMTRAEVKAKFDEIVAFAEVETFLDTPVKRYSSGMYVRLAFAVAAHLEPEILIIDEVLAVGDAEFQKKCLGKMQSVSAVGGRTVIFVSHNMKGVGNLCSKAVLLDHGRAALFGQSSTVIEHYLVQIANSAICAENQIWPDPEVAPGNDRIRLRRINVLPEGTSGAQEIHLDTPVSVEIEYWNLKPGPRAAINLQIYGIDGGEVFEDWSVEKIPRDGHPTAAGLYKTTCRIPALLLNEGTFQIRIIFFDIDSVRVIYEWSETAVFIVHDVTERPVNWHGRFIGPVHPVLEWRTHLIESM